MKLVKIEFFIIQFILKQVLLVKTGVQINFDYLEITMQKSGETYLDNGLLSIGSKQTYDLNFFFDNSKYKMLQISNGDELPKLSYIKIFHENLLLKENIVIKLEDTSSSTSTNPIFHIFYQSQRFTFFQTKCKHCYSLNGDILFSAEIRFFPASIDFPNFRYLSIKIKKSKLKFSEELRDLKGYLKMRITNQEEQYQLHKISQHKKSLLIYESVDNDAFFRSTTNNILFTYLYSSINSGTFEYKDIAKTEAKNILHPFESKIITIENIDGGNEHLLEAEISYYSKGYFGQASSQEVTTNNLYSIRQKPTNQYICDDKNCLNGGICVKNNEQNVCKCTENYYGSTCEHKIGFICKNRKYINHDECSSECNPGWSGPYCDNIACHDYHCQNNATCRVVNNKIKCICDKYTVGELCQFKCYKCIYGKCDFINNFTRCVCQKGYTGKDCSVSIHLKAPIIDKNFTMKLECIVIIMLWMFIIYQIQSLKYGGTINVAYEEMTYKSFDKTIHWIMNRAKYIHTEKMAEEIYGYTYYSNPEEYKSFLFESDYESKIDKYIIYLKGANTINRL